MSFDPGSLGAGGIIIVVLGLLSALSLTIILVKILELLPARTGAARRETAISLWASGDKAQAQETVNNGKSPADRVMIYAMTSLTSGFTGPLLNAELLRRGNEEFAKMNSLIRVLELIAMISPLLGLLGTVLGMIQSFQALEMAQGAANASILAGGIWQALLTTAVGLLVAIPAAVGATLLSARAESAAQMIENSVGRLMLVEENPNAV
ncbi:MotA/TolQ/ExbB proton channel family protein [Sulfitobacter sp. M57]|uniref:MotA/TolQ/ExbB proton channel family protein n=1 Tax=unclassified Sulfitobacter TaxID=196795 RepID=UPI0023E192F9|nr:MULTISPECIES: MotA/TolQ/ExbB proton channel family protein [unclassified Sulfitobacter]MDF3416588.1 MotA/TolQ/ExbB proton channel family protein [Sulfitobacter sp. KE5]MDF3424068.1 MotA/TolQ/ExbB proton channel family protein [Sulfitobacter sp. KE43]MDF3435133.1 MotA/TolQ/ExbB proton channel family protein [Sulfitobacter sp. KE42]MDF3460773.1 MotA/TolQ/ExbB proton channel family protein [Sulfitobacter sp. S74]MDF3464670.1 MotA/TolQ/ExbB proton channel family protein [Sulfitobacter sp. Ks18]